MRREFSAINAVSILVFFLAAAVVCLQIAHAKALPAWSLPPGVIWALEIAIFGMTVYLWRRRISLGPWLLAIAALVLVRIALTHASAFGCSLVQAGASHQAGLREMSQPLPRICAAFFSLIVLYRLRSFLPTTLLPARSHRRSAPRAAAFAFPDAPTSDANDPALWFVRGEEKIPVWLDARHGAGGDASISATTPVEQIEGWLDLPLREVLAQIPQEFVSEKADRCDDAELVSLPLSVIAPQLREARIVVRLDDLCDRLPSGIINLPDAWPGPEEEIPLVLLPLELIVPRLPSEILELRPVAPPAWARLEYGERVIFARL